MFGLWKTVEPVLRWHPVGATDTPERAAFWRVNQTTAWTRYQSKSHWKQSADMIHLVPTAGEIRGRDSWHAAGIRRGVESIIASPLQSVSPAFSTPLGVLIILRRVWRKSYPRWLWNTPWRHWGEKERERGRRDLIFSFANELLDELI